MPRVVRIINRLNLGGPTFNSALLTKYMAPDFETLLVREQEVFFHHALDVARWNRVQIENVDDLDLYRLRKRIVGVTFAHQQLTK